LFSVINLLVIRFFKNKYKDILRCRMIDTCCWIPKSLRAKQSRLSYRIVILRLSLYDDGWVQQPRNID
jgi:hypothetical protein